MSDPISVAIIQTGYNLMIGGFLVVTQPTKVIIRAAGPSLSQIRDG